MAMKCFLIILFVWYCYGHNISNTKDMPHKIYVEDRNIKRNILNILKANMGKDPMGVVQDGMKIALQFKTTLVLPNDVIKNCSD